MSDFLIGRNEEGHKDGTEIREGINMAPSHCKREKK